MLDLQGLIYWMNYQLICHDYIVRFSRVIIQLEDLNNLEQELDRISYKTVFNESCQESWGLIRGRGLTELVRLLWVLSGHEWAEVHEAITELSGSEHTTSEQYFGLGTSQKSRYLIDLVKIIQW